MYRGALSEEDQRLLADTYFQEGLEAKRDQERLLNEIQAHRFQEAQKANLDTKEKIKNLNDIRFALIEKHEQLLQKKALQSEFMKKGYSYVRYIIIRIEYLAEVELGNAPPLEMIAKNLNPNPEEYRRQTDLTEILKNGPGYVNQAQRRIKEIVTEVFI
jgi:hypothetical protein